MNHDQLLADLRQSEGLRLKPYQDTVGVWTVGYGRNLQAKGIRHGEAELMLTNDAAEAIRDARTYPWFQGLTDARQRCVVEMVFNLGAAGFAKFIGTIQAIAAGKYDMAATRMLRSKWATQVGRRADRLADQMRKG